MNESLAIARHPRTQYCKVDGGVCQPWASRQYQLDPDYQSLNWPIAAERLKLASGRMARLLDCPIDRPRMMIDRVVSQVRFAALRPHCNFMKPDWAGTGCLFTKTFMRV